MPYWFPPAPTSPPNAKNVEALFDQTLCLFLEKTKKKMLVQPLTEGQSQQSNQFLQQV